MRERLCRLEDIPDGEARGFERGAVDGFLVRRGNAVHAYHNICPHAGNPLNWKPDAFLTRDRKLIMCAVHGAMFEIGSGQCIAGPCAGHSLDSLDVRVEGEEVVLYTQD